MLQLGHSRAKTTVVQSLPLLHLTHTSIKYYKTHTHQKLIPAWSVYSKCFWNLPQLWCQNLKVPVTGKTIPITSRRIMRSNGSTRLAYEQLSVNNGLSEFLHHQEKWQRRTKSLFKCSGPHFLIFQ